MIIEGAVERITAAQNTARLMARETRESVGPLEMKMRNGAYEIQDLKRHKEQVLNRKLNIFN